MSFSRRTLLGGAAAVSAAPILRARAQMKPKIKLGVLTDLSGESRRQELVLHHRRLCVRPHSERADGGTGGEGRRQGAGKGALSVPGRADGRGLFPAYQWRVKKPGESEMEWDLFDPILESPSSEVVHPLNAKCTFPS